MKNLKISEQAFVRELNTSAVMDYIRLYAPISRAELANRSGLNRSTITHIVNQLIDRGFIHETYRQDPKIGRPGIMLQFNPEAGFAIGVEIGVDFISAVATNFVSDVLWRRYELIPAGTEQYAIMEMAENVISEAMEYGRGRGLRPLGIGVGVPGLVDARQGKLAFAPNLHWVDMPIRLIWMSRFNIPVFVENEANCAALGEFFYGVAYNVKDFIYLKTGVGLGGGIMINGQLFRGYSGFAGEVGHTSLYGDGELCGCGRRGCWETYVSQAAIVHSACQKLARGEASSLHEKTGHDDNRLSLEMLIEAAQQNDPVALKTFAEIGAHMGTGISNLVNTFNPELIVLGGMLSLCSAWIIPVIQQSFKDCILPPLREGIRLEVSTQGEDACTLGAVALVLDDILREPMFSMQGSSPSF